MKKITVKSFSLEFSTLDTIFLILAVSTGNLLLASCYLLVCYACGQFKLGLLNRTLTRVNSQFSYYLYQRSLCEYPSVAYDRYQRVCQKLRRYRQQLE